MYDLRYVAYDLLTYNMESATLTVDSTCNGKWRCCHLMFYLYIDVWQF